MMSRNPAYDQLSYRRSARQDFRCWAMFVTGSVFVFASLNIDPRNNCSTGGECAPWLVPIAFALGALVGIGGLGRLLANPNRGSRIDKDGALIWWQNRMGETGGDEGRIDPADIGHIRIVKQSEASDEVHLYDRNGTRQFYFDEEVIGWDQERWATKMRDHFTHIRVDIVERR